MWWAQGFGDHLKFFKLFKDGIKPVWDGIRTSS
jgi:hypothetical protein